MACLELCYDLSGYGVEGDQNGQLLGCAGIAEGVGEYESSCARDQCLLGLVQGGCDEV